MLNVFIVRISFQLVVVGLVASFAEYKNLKKEDKAKHSLWEFMFYSAIFPIVAFLPEKKNKDDSLG